MVRGFPLAAKQMDEVLCLGGGGQASYLSVAPYKIYLKSSFYDPSLECRPPAVSGLGTARAMGA